MKQRRIYVDIDDVLSATIERLIDLLEDHHGRRVEVKDVLHFDLEKSFDLSSAEIVTFMEAAHEDAVIESIVPAEGAGSVLADWQSDGDEIALVTGRPPSTNAASKRWLSTHGLAHDALHHLDKWGRPSWNQAGLPALRFDEIPALEFGFAVEDSLDTAVRLVEEFDLPVCLMDRPWNRSTESLPTNTRDRLLRCASWEDVADASRSLG
ncbi:MAG: hypothetical protein AB8G23_03210 [Myxococcota bacterium]